MRDPNYPFDRVGFDPDDEDDLKFLDLGEGSEPTTMQEFRDP
eukprot:CAMPEP_0170545670 /NCGR_PEP_ID=MMETSP0211-20121228/4029_1 /TAXON_ID=311385 /ORGANISM="Pseudokeronopsis sp., Strain OXSARD2" /LENGTH=41 /DNA_ID= /DNA_START= /DNA_END= /DNA_ORIENTATION=